MIRWITVLAAAAGLALAMAAITPTFPTPPDLPPERQPPVNPFPKGVVALGTVECARREAAIASPLAGVVVRVHREVGEAVRAGDPLFELDDRALRAQLVRARAGIAVKQAAIDRWRALPRAEDLPPLRAALRRAEADLADGRDNAERLRNAVDSGARAQRDLAEAQFAVDQASARVEQARADLQRAQAGGWAPDLQAAQAELAEQEAEVRSIEIELDRLIVRSPSDGTVLRRDIEPGERTRDDPARPMVMVGDLSTLHVRAQIDEEDFALIASGVKAIGRTRGAVVRDFALDISRIEPFARPKTLLAGVNSERVDTRTVDVVLRVVGERRGLVPGQAIDVYIEVPTVP